MKLRKTRTGQFELGNWETPTKAQMQRKLGAKGYFRWSLIVSFCLSAVAFTNIARAGESVSPSADAQPMTGVELYMLYRDKSWAWTDGAGRFDDAERRFTASTGAGDKIAWAQGRWIVTDDGRLCLNAEWHTMSGVHANRSCFSHKRAGETIYQKKEPSGSWYIFRHAVPTETDEFKKLVAENLVSADIGTIKSDLQNQKRLAGNTLTNASKRKTQ
ncbi:DUF995 domain-containing protein [Phyllobacterium zundukense]|jgi:hypothetical protein|uniref:DUF995 domain-containing protein n=1 Tax=Phyllobacterium zundukense TaxID=1867719 RepID=A0ACD4D7F7_9HYPH|nr:DUF995 domain-containing protein [Phyllobacterium zundukense]UXN61638.1 DUF995 domain-containing protein [Phyllobacterium zundukense]